MKEEICPECGAKITGKTGFCSECGAVTTSLNNEIEETNEFIKENNEILKNGEICPECGAKITGKTGFCSECGAVTTSLNNEIEETNEIIKENKKIADLQRWYHKPDKDHKMAILYSIFLPFSGNFYLRENIDDLFLTILSILFILGNIIGLLTIDDFYFRYNNLIYIYSLLWIVSIFALCCIVFNYNKRKVYYKKDEEKYSKESPLTNFFIKDYIKYIPFISVIFEEKYSKESPLTNFFIKDYIKYIPFILVILFLIVNTGVMFSDSPKTFDTPDFSFHYPHEYISYGSWNYNSAQDFYTGNAWKPDGGDDSIEIVEYSAPSSDDTLHSKYYSYNILRSGIYKGRTKVDNREAYIVQDKYSAWSCVIFSKDGHEYYWKFDGESQKDMDTIIKSFKFK